MISTSMQDALSEQLNHEFYSAYLYLAMAAYCSNSDFNGAASWMEVQYEEEIQHATRIYRYLIDQGVLVKLGQIDEPPSEFGSLLDVFQASLAHEQSMTIRSSTISATRPCPRRTTPPTTCCSGSSTSRSKRKRPSAPSSPRSGW